MPFPLQRVLDPIVEPVSLPEMKMHLRVDFDYEDDLISTLISATRERAEDLTGRCLLSQQWLFAMDKFPTWYGHESGALYFGEHRHPRHHSMFRSDNIAIILPRGPVLSIDSITWKDFSSQPNTLDPATYNADLLSEPTRLRPLFNGSWPFAMFDTNSVQIKFTCGYQQTVTETLTVTADAPKTITPSRYKTFLSLTSIVDVASSAPITGSTIENGVISNSTFTNGQTIAVVYKVSNIPQAFLLAMKLMAASWYENRSEVVQGGGNFNSMPTPLGASSLLSTYELFKVGYPQG